MSGDFRDIESINVYRELVEEKKIFDSNTMMRYLRYKSCDNARMPMQWDDEKLYVYTRTLGEEELYVLCNFSEHERQVKMPEEFINSRVLIGNYADIEVQPVLRVRRMKLLC